MEAGGWGKPGRLEARAEGVEAPQLLAREGVGRLVCDRQVCPQPRIAQLGRLDYLLHDPAAPRWHPRPPGACRCRASPRRRPAPCPGGRRSDRCHPGQRVDGRGEIACERLLPSPLRRARTVGGSAPPVLPRARPRPLRRGQLRERSRHRRAQPMRREPPRGRTRPPSQRRTTRRAPRRRGALGHSKRRRRGPPPPTHDAASTQPWALEITVATSSDRSPATSPSANPRPAARP